MLPRRHSSLLALFYIIYDLSKFTTCTSIFLIKSCGKIICESAVRNVWLKTCSSLIVKTDYKAYKGHFLKLYK